jgi:hypothetical protein
MALRDPIGPTSVHPATSRYEAGGIPMNRGGFSWKRFVGLSATKSRISRAIGIPLTRSGRQRKLGAALGCGTLSLVLFSLVALSVLVLVWASS